MGRTYDDVLAWLIAAEAAVPMEEEPYGSYGYSIAIHHLEDPAMGWYCNCEAGDVIRALWEAIPAVDWAGPHIGKVLQAKGTIEDCLVALAVETIGPNMGTIDENLLDYLTTEQQQAIAERLLAAIRAAK